MKKIIQAILILCVTFSMGQELKLEKATADFEQLNYINAKEIYLRVAKKGYVSEELFKRLGDIYYFNSDYGEAENWYHKLFEEYEVTDPQYLLRYSQALKSRGNDSLAAVTYDAFLERTGVLDDNLTSSLDYGQIIARNSDRVDLVSISFNSDDIDFGTFIQGDNLYFSSSRSKGGTKMIDTWSSYPFLDIYKVKIKSGDFEFGKPKPVKGAINEKFHESTPVITNDGSFMYFTRTNTSPRIERKKSEVDHLKIYRAAHINGKWKNIEDLSINGDNYSTAHPALSPDGNTLYFVSDMPGGIGETDIYSVFINADGSLGKPINLGPAINTKGRESFPFITNDQGLYFSSDGHFGLGGYDIFYVDLKSSRKELYNIGEPTNGPFDDYSFWMDDATKKGFFSSNRDGVDNIYGFVEKRSVTAAFEQELSGTISDTKTGEPLQGAKITLLEDNLNILETDRTDEKGTYQLIRNIREDYTVRVDMEGYDTTDKYIPKGFESPLNLALNKNSVKSISKDVEADLSDVLNLNKIYFDFDDYTLTDDSIVELEKIIQALQLHPEIKISIRSHSDSRGTSNYNLRLSQKRARATFNYLVRNGISPSRLQYVGLGERYLLNDCDEKMDCSEEKHLENRRTEFIIGHGTNNDFDHRGLEEGTADETYEWQLEEDARKGFYLIANVFKTEKYFKSFMNHLQNGGFQPKVFEKDRLLYVYLGYFSSYEEAKIELNRLNEGVYQEELWIYEVE
ncbi:MAG TPA: cell envelope biogenesis protein OmpA [Muricauda sp.]|nr:OmpA family protein [uncultured Allomuricauda sp.]MBC71270.1 cell envelope biogenesis protein OmpA [Allomuricauda sp.]HBU77687.1 cell envelope biogenesis protein OmpA [Allomuricauda sp.]|tara:strand:- start:1476 stop:3692 length:2217 start_codon:yes stop_codon:yes gene_type:complete